MLQQHLPFTVLKLSKSTPEVKISNSGLQQHLPFTVLKLFEKIFLRFDIQQKLQQHLPFTVLKLSFKPCLFTTTYKQLQQHLPFTVLKLIKPCWQRFIYVVCCNSTYRLRYWNEILIIPAFRKFKIVATAPTVYGIETFWRLLHG